jgi:SAM-dependent methyltransferase
MRLNIFLYLLKIKEEFMKLKNEGRNILEKFPKERKKLPEEYQVIYEKHYIENRNGKTKMSFLSQLMERWLHRSVAKSGGTNKKTLEIGAGTLNQLKWEKEAVYDIVEPFKSLYENSPEINRINKIYNDISEINNSEKYDRIISCACFEHILNLSEVIARTCFLLKEGGGLYVSIPNEGRFLWKMGYKFTTGLEFKKRYNLDYDMIMKYEHVNTADEIDILLKYFYKKISVKLFGVNKTFALYRYYECKKPDIEKAKEYLDKLWKSKNGT